LHSQLSICVFAEPLLVTSLQELLSRDRYQCHSFDVTDEFLHYVKQHKDTIDCLILQNVRSSLSALSDLYEQGALFPLVIVEPPASTNTQRQAGANPETGVSSADSSKGAASRYLYHTGEVWLLETQLEHVGDAIDRAIARFLKLPPQAAAPAAGEPSALPPLTQPSLRSQQRRLADKLKERLGYLGVYYKRNPQDFFRHLSQLERQQLIETLREEYREIILNYFIANYPLNQAIDQLVNRAFFADLSVSQILEIHMELMDEFAQQLKLEGRSDEILIDYRLVLIDIIAHLCEMYRRSIPREDIPYEIFFRDE